MESFKLFNIKSFSKTSEIELKKINVFVGRNSSGKSSLIRFPVVLSQTFQEDIYTPILLFGKLIDYGNFDDVIYNHKGDNFGFGFKYSTSKLRDQFMRRSMYFRDEFRYSFRMLHRNFDNVQIEVKVKKHNKRIIVDNFKLFMDEKELLEISREPKKNRYELKVNYLLRIEEAELFLIDNPRTLNASITFNKFMPEIDLRRKSIDQVFTNFLAFEKISDSEIIELLQNYMLHNKINEVLEEFRNKGKSGDEINKALQLIDLLQSIHFYSAILNSINNELNNFAQEVTYIGPFRKDPERIYRDSENSFNDVGKNGEHTSVLLRQAEQKKNPLLPKVSDWFKSSMGYSIDIDEIENSNLYKVVVSSIDGKNKDNLIDVGYGIAQVLPIVTQAFLDYNVNEELRRTVYKFSKKSLLIIEQPELHLHPAAQASLANLFAEKVVSEPSSKIIIETHSEHLIRRLQVLIADPDVEIGPNDIAIYYVDKGLEGSYVKKMDINEKGQFISEWPSGFFDKSYELSKELLSMSKKKGTVRNET